MATATARRPRDPCRDIGSAPSAIAADEMGLAKVTVPVLVVSGAEDRLFLPPTPRRQAGAFSGSRDVTAVELPRTGHAVTLGRSAPGFTRVVARWLGHRGF